MVARESWELLEDANVILESFGECFFFPPPPPPAFSLLRLLIEASLQAKAKGMHFMAGILGGLACTRFLAG